MVDAAVAALRAAAPALSVAIREVRPAEIAPALRERRLDVVLARSTPAAPGLDLVTLPPTPAVLVVPPDHRLAGRSA